MERGPVEERGNWETGARFLVHIYRAASKPSSNETLYKMSHHCFFTMVPCRYSDPMSQMKTLRP